MADQIISQEYLHQIFDYKDGELYWKIKPSKPVSIGDVAGCLDKNGYKKVRINKKGYLSHRLIYLYHHNFLPRMIDHIDTNKLNNRIENLREIDLSKNGYNAKISIKNKSKVKGVCWHKLMKKWVAQLTINGKQKVLGYFENINDAKIYVEKMREIYHGEFASHG